MRLVIVTWTVALTVIVVVVVVQSVRLKARFWIESLCQNKNTSVSLSNEV